MAEIDKTALVRSISAGACSRGHVEGGLLITVTATSAQDSVDGTQLLASIAATHKVWVDGGCRKQFVEQAATLGIDMEITAGAPGAEVLTPDPETPDHARAEPARPSLLPRSRPHHGLTGLTVCHG
ncbi:hypothetical protein ACFUIY_10185 [Streptomyces griseorubiginosus]|uniref:hypothetical protein n=1 Tax=Streptomyces griseorubiginosus TaxID=67304 RepID=UPI00363849DF